MSTSYSERMAIYDRVDRNAKLATTYLRKASDWLHDVKPIPTQYWALLDAALAAAVEIVAKLPDSFFVSEPTEDWLGLAVRGEKLNLSDGPLEAARKLVTALEGRRRRVDVLRKVGRLEDPSGRTPEEAALFAQKAAELRARHELPSET